MAENKDIPLVSVDADDEDDFVIQAGNVPAAQKPSTRVSAVDSADAAVASGVGADSPRGDDGVLEAQTQQDALRAQKLAEAQARARAREEDPNRMITTEEDLHAEVPFAGMQRTVLIVLGIFAVVFIIYCVAFHPFS